MLTTIKALRELLHRLVGAPTKLTVAGKIEQSKVPYTAFHLSPNRPDVLGAERRLRPDDLALFQGTRPEAVAGVLEISVMATLLSW
jgi:hypothetical protein